MSDNCDSPQAPLIPFEQARSRLLEQASVVKEVTPCELDKLKGLTCAQAVVSDVDIPAYDNSAMDGYALNLSGSKTHFKVVDTVLAGHPTDITLEANACARIMTGAPIPKGTDAVVMQEKVLRNGDFIELEQAVEPGANIRPKGEDVHTGLEVFAKGHRFSARDIGLLAAIGVDQVNVYRRLKVALLSSGDELQEPGTQLEPGHTFDANRALLKAMLKSIDVDVIDMGIIEDNPDALRSALKDASERADVVMSSAGVSVGDADFVKDILCELGDIGFWKVAIKPGKPFAYGTLGDAAFIGLPGNPVSAAVTCEQLAIPYLKKRQGRHDLIAPKVQAICLDDIRKKPGRLEFQRGIAHLNDQGQWQVSSAGKQGSGILRSLSRANCHIVLAADSEGVQKNELVAIVPYQHL